MKASRNFYIAGVGFFVLAFVSDALVPWLMYNDMPEKTVAELINSNLRYQFEDPARRYRNRSKRLSENLQAAKPKHDAWWNEKCCR
ncbi:MAG: hypothetical protein U0936_10905 [Planctomycetaceae bacterium]